MTITVDEKYDKKKRKWTSKEEMLRFTIDLDKEIFEVEVFVIVEKENIAVVWAVLASLWWNPWLSGKCDSLRKKPMFGLSPENFCVMFRWPSRNCAAKPDGSFEDFRRENLVVAHQSLNLSLMRWHPSFHSEINKDLSDGNCRYDSF